MSYLFQVKFLLNIVKMANCHRVGVSACRRVIVSSCHRVGDEVAKGDA